MVPIGKPINATKAIAYPTDIPCFCPSSTAFATPNIQFEQITKNTVIVAEISQEGEAGTPKMNIAKAIIKKTNKRPTPKKANAINLSKIPAILKLLMTGTSAVSVRV